MGQCGFWGVPRSGLGCSSDSLNVLVRAADPDDYVRTINLFPKADRLTDRSGVFIRRKSCCIDQVGIKLAPACRFRLLVLGLKAWTTCMTLIYFSNFNSVLCVHVCVEVREQPLSDRFFMGSDYGTQEGQGLWQVPLPADPWCY